jgi:hypothetical protein
MKFEMTNRGFIWSNGVGQEAHGLDEAMIDQDNLAVILDRRREGLAHTLAPLHYVIRGNPIATTR